MNVTNPFSQPDGNFNLKHGTFITQLEGSPHTELTESPSKAKAANTRSSTKVIETLYGQIDHLTKSNLNLTSQNQDLLKQISILNNQISKLNRTNEVSRSEINTKDLKIKKLEKNNKKYQDQLERFEKDYDFLRNQFLESSKSNDRHNKILENEIEDLKLSIDRMLNADQISSFYKHFEQKSKEIDVSFVNLKQKLIEEMDTLKVENGESINKLEEYYYKAQDLLSEFDNANETKREYLAEQNKGKFNEEVAKLNERQSYLDETLAQLQSNNNVVLESNKNKFKNQSHNGNYNRGVRRSSSMYHSSSGFDNSSRKNFFNNTSNNSFKQTSSASNRYSTLSPNTNKRASRFYGSHHSSEESLSNSTKNSPLMNVPVDLSYKRKSFLAGGHNNFSDDTKNSTRKHLGLGLLSNTGTNENVSSTSKTRSISSNSKALNSDSRNNLNNDNESKGLPGLKRGGSIRRG